MKLQLLIPQYNETDEVIKPLLDSILIQQSIDFNEIGLIIVNDGSEVFLTEDFLQSYRNIYDIQYYKHEHKGVSATRNACLDYATADYVMFCDADDMFFNSCGLYIIFREMNKEKFDSMLSIFIEENHVNNQIIYVNRDMDKTFVHGKVHRRQFLIDNNIRWDDALTIHEDSYFNCLCQELAEELKYCKTPFYLWKWRKSSVCRHDDEYILKTYSNMLDSNTALVNEFIRRKKIEKAQFYATAMIYDAYYTLNKKEWIDKTNQNYRDIVEKRFYKYYCDFKVLFDAVPDSLRIQIIAGVRNRMFNEGLMLESITFDDWIASITNKYKNTVSNL